MLALHSESLGLKLERKFDSELVYVSQWFNGRMPALKTRDLRFKSQVRQIFLSIIINRARNYMKFHVLNYWSENKVTKYIYILRCAKFNGTKEKFLI